MSKTDIRYTATLTALKMAGSNGFINLTENDFEFLTQDSCWIGSDRARGRMCIEGAVYGSLDYLGLPRFAVPAEIVAGVIAYFVHPSNYMYAAHVMEGCEWSENLIAGIERSLSARDIFAHVLQIASGNEELMNNSFKVEQRRLKGALNG